MSYQVLARKWRPRKFADVVGQDHVVRALSNALNSGRLHHAYLFTGTRGVGKTTIARILAKSLNCETGVSANPCGQCAACTEIDAGRFPDLLEIDAATNTRVEEMRQLLENAVYSPSRGRFKVYVIDEVHMLSTSAFNAMLKTLEEPPEHVKFILATTDPQKIPVTVLSRCLQFTLKQMAPQSVEQHLEKVTRVENIGADPDALALIAQSAHGSMRDALSLLDQAIAYGGGVLKGDDVRAMLGSVDRDCLYRVLRAVASGAIDQAVAVAYEMSSRSFAFDDALQEMAAILQRVALLQAVPDRDALFSEALDEQPQQRHLAEQIDRETVQLLYQIAIHARRELTLAPDELAGFTMALLRMTAFMPAAAGGSRPSAIATTTPATSPFNSPPTFQAVAPSSRSSHSAGVSFNDRDIPQAAPVVIQPPLPRPTIRDQDGSFAGASDPPSEWPELVRGLKLSGFAKQLGERSELISQSQSKYRLRLTPAAKQLAGYADKLRMAIEENLGRKVTIEIEIGETSGSTVAAQEDATRGAREDAARATIDADPFVRALRTDFGATVEFVRPINDLNESR